MTVWQKAALGAIAVSFAILLSSCSSSPSKYAATTSSVSVTTASTTPGLDSDGPFCKEVAADASIVNSSSQAFDSLVGSSNFADARKGFTEVLTQLEAGALKVEKATTSTPADVKAALDEQISYIKSLQIVVNEASGVASLEQGFQKASTPAFVSSEAVLSKYEATECGK